MHKQYEKLLNKLKAEAQDKHVGLPQYDGRWDDFVLVRIERRVDARKRGLAFLRGEIMMGDGSDTVYCPRFNNNVKVSPDDFSVISPDANPRKMGPTWKDCVINAFDVDSVVFREGLLQSILDDEGAGDALVLEIGLVENTETIFNAWVTKKADVGLELESYDPVEHHSDIKVFDLENFGKEFGRVYCFRRFEFES